MTAGVPQGGLPQRPDRLREMWDRAGKILSQEARTACADKTVMGGLEKFVSNWYSSISTMEAGHHSWQDARRVTALLRGYSGLSPEERALGVLPAVVVARFHGGNGAVPVGDKLLQAAHDRLVRKGGAGFLGEDLAGALPHLSEPVGPLGEAALRNAGSHLRLLPIFANES